MEHASELQQLAELFRVGSDVLRQIARASTDDQRLAALADEIDRTATELDAIGQAPASNAPPMSMMQGRDRRADKG